MLDEVTAALELRHDAKHGDQLAHRVRGGRRRQLVVDEVFDHRSQRVHGLIGRDQGPGRFPVSVEEGLDGRGQVLAHHGEEPEDQSVDVGDGSVGH